MKNLCFISGLLMTIVYTAECAITGWTEPTISGPDGNAAASSTVAEDATSATGITIAATNAASYELTAQTPTSGGTFAIDSSTGVLTFTGTLDYETVTEYVLTIVATEDASNKGTASVTVSITDVNDNDPAFAATTYAFRLDATTSSGFSVATITATDADGTAANNVVSQYSIEGGNTNNDFQVSSSGEITTANAMDNTVTAGYALTLRASDGTLTGDTTVFVIVKSCSSDAVALVSGSVITLMTVLVTKFL